LDAKNKHVASSTIKVKIRFPTTIRISLNIKNINCREKKVTIQFPTIIKNCLVMTNMDCRELLAHLHIPLGWQTEEMEYGMVLQHSLGCHGCWQAFFQLIFGWNWIAMISLPSMIKNCLVMINMAWWELLEHLHIPLGRHTEEMEWLFSTCLGVMAANKLYLPADFLLNNNDFLAKHDQKLPSWMLKINRLLPAQ
jgi:hypothetical protein